MQESNVDWIFKGPACIVLVFNLVFLFSIMWVSQSLWKKSKLTEINATLYNFNVLFSFHSLGAHYKTPFSQHSRNQTIPQGIQSTARTYPTSWTYLFNCHSRAKWRNWKIHFWYSSSFFAEYTGNLSFTANSFIH